MNKKKLISEDLKRYQQLLEYTFYVPEKEEGEVDDLLLDDMLTEQDPPAEDEDPFFDVGGEDPVAAADETPEAGTEETSEEDVEVDTEETSEEGGETDPFGTDTEVEDEFADEDLGGDEETVEVDVTDIVDKTEETKASVDDMGQKMDDLLSKLGDLESQVTDMDGVINKIDDLEKEIERRNPTPVERLEMRSMDSFPYSVKLTDFWNDREGYEATSEEDEEQEYTLTKQDIDDDYSEVDIRGSFNPKGKE